MMQFSVNSERYFITKFDTWLWLSTVERVIVESDGTLVFKFYYGAEIKV